MVENGNGALLPYDVVVNILKRVPARSLIRFRCVSKEWGKLLESPFFVAQHLSHSSHTNPFLLLQRIHGHIPSSCCLVAPDLALHPLHLTSYTCRIVASCNGVLCVQHPDHALSLFNPATRQINHLPQTLNPQNDVDPFHYVGFGFSPLLNDYNIVRISISGHNHEGFVVLDEIRVNRAQVFSLNASSWTEIDTVQLRNLSLVSTSVAASGAIFWLATAASDDYSEFVVSFDMVSQAFTLLKGPPPPLSHRNTLAVCNDKLAMFRQFVVGNYESCSIDFWVLEHTRSGSEESWIKMCSVRHPSGMLYPLCIWRGEIVCNQELNGEGVVKTVLCLFNPSTNQLKKLPANRDEYSYVSFNYVQSLVPVDTAPRQL